MSVYTDKRNGHFGYNFMFNGIRYHKVFPEAKSLDEVQGYELIAKAQLRQKGYGIEKNQYNSSLAEIIKDYNVYARIYLFD